MTTAQIAKAIAHTTQPTPTGARLDLKIYLGYDNGHLRINDGHGTHDIPCDNGVIAMEVLAKILHEAQSHVERTRRRAA